MAVIEGLGAIAGNFAEGYRQARAQKQQETLAQHQQQYEHANRLFQMADQIQDPKMKDTLYSSATQLLDALDSPNANKKNPKGIGAMFASMFGIGHHKDTPAASESNQPLGPPKPPDLTAPGAVSPDSHTYGSLSGQFGPELDARPVSPAVNASALPQVPSMDAMPSAGSVASSAFPHIPQISDPRGTPVTAAPIAAQMPAVDQAPAPASAPKQAALPKLPRSEDLIQEAKSNAEKQFPDAVGQRFQRADAVSKGVAASAKHNADVLLQITDQHLRENGHLRTVIDAANDPVHGADFRNVMDAIQDYESRGLLPKGYVENWQKTRFQDSEKYDPTKTETTADGERFQWNPVDNRYSIPLGGKKPEPKATFDQNVDAAYSVPEASRTPEQKNVIAGYLEKLKQGDRSKMDPTQQMQSDWLNDPKNKVGTTDQIASKFQARFHPLPIPTPVAIPGYDPVTHTTDIYTLNRATGKSEKTGIRTAGSPFIPERYQREIVIQTPNKLNPRIMDERKDQAFSADKLISAHSSGDTAVSLDTLVDLLKSGVTFSAEDRQKLSDYVNRQLKPAF